MTKIIKQISDSNPVVEGKIYQFGVQAPKGSIIYFNGDQENKVIMGSTEIFQAELNEGSYITSIEVISANTNVLSYIDVIMEEGS